MTIAVGRDGAGGSCITNVVGRDDLSGIYGGAKVPASRAVSSDLFAAALGLCRQKADLPTALAVGPWGTIRVLLDFTYGTATYADRACLVCGGPI